MVFINLKKEICWFWNTEINGNITQEKIEP